MSAHFGSVELKPRQVWSFKRALGKHASYCVISPKGCCTQNEQLRLIRAAKHVIGIPKSEIARQVSMANDYAFDMHGRLIGSQGDQWILD